MYCISEQVTRAVVSENSKKVPDDWVELRFMSFSFRVQTYILYLCSAKNSKKGKYVFDTIIVIWTIYDRVEWKFMSFWCSFEWETNTRQIADNRGELITRLESVSIWWYIQIQHNLRKGFFVFRSMWSKL